MASKTGIPLHELDNYLWKDNWDSVPPEVFEKQHREIIDTESWIIDGFGLPNTIEPRLRRSTRIVFIDLPIWMHFALAAERQAVWKQGKLTHPPGGMKAAPPTKILFELMWKIHTELTPSVNQWVQQAAESECVVETVHTLDRLRELQFNPMSV